MLETAIISGKGGTGKSSLTAAFASLAQRVVLADCDVDASNLPVLFPLENPHIQPFVGSYEAVINASLCDHCGACLDHCRFGAISRVNGKVCISDVYCDGCGVCTRVCPRQAVALVERADSRLCSGAFRYGHMVYGRLAPGEEHSGKLVSLVREQAREQAQNRGINHVLIDGPPGIGCPVIAAMTGVGQVVIVAEPGVSGMHDLKRIWSLCQAVHMPAWVIINKWDLHRAGSRAMEALCRKQNIRLAGKLPFDPMVVDAMAHLKTVVEWVPGSTIASAIAKAWQKISAF